MLKKMMMMKVVLLVVASRCVEIVGTGQRRSVDIVGVGLVVRVEGMIVLLT